jgi:protein-disulfide isomerase
MDKRFLITLGVILVGFFGFVIFSRVESSKNQIVSEGSKNFYGNMESKVTFTEFVDFQCEACYAYYPHVKQLKEAYKDRVKFQIRNFPITSGHQFAKSAAASAESAARQGKFWEMHDLIFEGQKQWERAENPQAQYFEKYAQQIGLNMDKYREDLGSDEVNAVIMKDLQDVKALGGTGTPTIAINGKKIELPGPDFEKLSKLLDDALASSGQQ